MNNKSLFKSSWQASSNIALVKYWGKRGRQLPQNPSVSFSLSKCVSKTQVEIFNSDEKGTLVDYTFSGELKPEFAHRISQFLNGIHDICPKLNDKKLIIASTNTFPHSAGIASSASFYASLAMSLMEFGCMDTELNDHQKLQFASQLARLGSGSASRSVFGGFCSWGKIKNLSATHDEFASPINDIHQEFIGLQDSICIVDNGAKQVSSSQGHKLMNFHPYAQARFALANENSATLVDVLKNGDWETFGEIIETEALGLHALMMQSLPSVILLKPKTLTLIEEVKEIRSALNIPLYFTLDAGPNLHLIYRKSDKVKIQNELQELSHSMEIEMIHDEQGQGPSKLEL